MKNALSMAGMSSAASNANAAVEAEAEAQSQQESDKMDSLASDSIVIEKKVTPAVPINKPKTVKKDKKAA